MYVCFFIYSRIYRFKCTFYLYPIAVVPKDDEKMKKVKELRANQLLERELEKLKKQKNADDDLDDNLKQFLLKHQESSDSLPSN